MGSWHFGWSFVRDVGFVNLQRCNHRHGEKTIPVMAEPQRHTGSGGSGGQEEQAHAGQSRAGHSEIKALRRELTTNAGGVDLMMINSP